MGQKVNPHGLRVGIIKDWDSKWYANKRDFADNLVGDFKIREFIRKELYVAGISSVYIDRLANEEVHINIFTGKPGKIVGKKGSNILVLKAKLEKLCGKKVKLDISEVENIDTDAQLVAENVAQSLERRISFRRAMKQVIGRTLRSGAKGIKVMVSGRLNGAEIARSEMYSEGNVPLSTLRANIDFGFAEADTAYGKLGIKVWIYKGEVISKLGEGKVLIRKKPRSKNVRNANQKNTRVNNKRNPRKRPATDKPRAKSEASDDNK
ncbi:MAG: 30S ribosomal protein S3 [Bacillota bacterium]|nr:30S ribosomal protein S3 [Bacillota bacterium]